MVNLIKDKTKKLDTAKPIKKRRVVKEIIEIRGDFTPLFSFISDTHLNIHQYNLKARAEDALNAAEQCLSKTHEMLGDDALVIHGGDVFNYPNVRPSGVLEANRVFNKYPLHILAIRGNHDGTFTKARRSDISLILLEETGALQYIENSIITRHFREIPNYGDVKINFILQSYMGNKTMDALWRLAGNLDEMNTVTSEGVDKTFNVLVIHEIIEGVSIGANVPRDEMMQFIDEYDIDLVLCGHLHIRSEDKQLKMLCPGSPECFDIDQCNEERGFYVIGLENSHLGYQWIPIHTRNMEDIHIDLGDVSQVDVNAVLEQEISDMNAEDGSIIRFVIKGMTSTFLPKIDRKLFDRKFATALKIMVVNRIQYSKENDVMDVEVMSPKRALKKALDELGVEKDRANKMAEAMIEASNEAADRSEGWRNEIRHIIQDLV